jgi:hypothetical protein
MSFFLALVALAQAAFLAGNPNTVTINGHMFSAEISKTVEQKVKGLMYRKELLDNSCMVFLNKEEAAKAGADLVSVNSVYFPKIWSFLALPKPARPYPDSS